MSENQFDPKSMSQRDALPYYTTRIECGLSDVSTSSGTGFFYAFMGKSDEPHIPAIVTNKHVVEGAIAGRCLFATHDSRGGPNDLNHLTVSGGSESKPFESFFIPHPDPDVDLCLIPMGPLIQQGKDIGKRPFFYTFDSSDLLTKEDLSLLSSLEEVVMVGYPNGLWDSLNNRPLLRSGVTATDVRKDYDGKKEFLIDIAAFPGSSGSPIIRLESPSHQDGSKVIRQKLLGVLYSGPLSTLTGEVVVMNVPEKQRVVANTEILINLAFISKSNELLGFEPVLSGLFS